ncbi:hypothetical protein CRYUN_Cryun20dG0122400 [Craigia yunnanensis]
MIHWKSLNQELDARGCDKLKKFPDVRRHLKKIILSDTAIEEVSSSIGYLNKLCHLNMSGTRIQNLPSSISYLESLERLDLSGCLVLVEIPPSIKQLPNLTSLSLRDAFDNIVADALSKFIARRRNGFKLKNKCEDYDHFESKWEYYRTEDQNPECFKSNHLIIWFDDEMLQKDKHYEEASFDFYIRGHSNEGRYDHIKVEKCGVHIFYVDEERILFIDSEEGSPSESVQL